MGIGITMQQEQAAAKRGLMQRLMHSQGGNIALMGAAIIVPVTLMIGSGVDFSRYYVIKSRIQLACDAGALAGRKVMGKTTFTSEAVAEANKFFDANFIAGSYGSEDLERQFTENDGIVEGVATVKMKTLILPLAQINEMDIAVECNGKLDVANTDVTFVLDTTGSMEIIDSGSTNRMSGLRQAVKDFSTTMEDAKSSNTVIRYGFVPYASNVRVGHLLRREWLSDSNTIQSREAVLNGTMSNLGGTDSGWQRISGSVAGPTTTSNLTSCSVTNATRTNYPTTSNTVTNADGSQTTTTVESYMLNGTENRCTSTYYWWAGTRYTRTRTVYSSTVYRRTVVNTVRPNYSWNYQPRTYDLTALKGNNSGNASPGASQSLQIGDLSNGYPTNRDVTWNGCIEEARTSQITNFANLPTPLYDLDINHVPTADEDTKWKMQVPRLAYGRGVELQLVNGSLNFVGTNNTLSAANITNSNTNFYSPQDYSTSHGQVACVNTARALTSMTPAEVGGYVDGLQAIGGTYHDIGMIWGGRLASPNGIFGASNTAAASAGLTRHVIFMTDGSTSPSALSLTAYGIEPLDQRRMGYWDNNDRQPAITMADRRLQLVCSQIKNENITLWVVAFGSDVLNSASTKLNLENCATPGKYFEAANNTVLRAQFVAIASQIAELRLVQ
jgi:Flp pilus assembly protein TadG